MNDNINSLETFISSIKKRTPMYLGGRTITHLKAFIDGWFFGSEEYIEDANLLEEFQLWLQEKYQVKGTQSWAGIILFYSNDEFDALQNFFALFDEFLESNFGSRSQGQS